MVDFSEKLLQKTEGKEGTEFSTEEREDFEKGLLRALYDREWCRDHGIDYVRPNVPLARIIFCREYYSRRQ